MTNELVTSAANLARQKTLMINRNPGIFYSIKALFLHLASNKGNPDLFFDALPGSSNEGLVNGACHLYGLYLKKGTGTTEADYKISNHATVVQADADIIVKSVTASEEVWIIWPSGHAFSTGMACGSYTAYNGSNVTTASTSGDQLSGFALVGG